MQERIIWRKEWLSIYESPFSIYDKICYANVITQSEFFKHFGSPLNNDVSFLLIRGLDYSKIENMISYPLLSQFHNSINNLSENFLSRFTRTDHFYNKDFYYCQICSLTGYHSLFFQFKFIKECPFHMEPLKNICRVCNQPLNYTYYKSSSISQCCTNCNEPVLLHQHTFPSFKSYTMRDIKSQDILDFLNLNLAKKEILKNTVFPQIENQTTKGDLNFVLYCLSERYNYLQNNLNGQNT